MGFIFSLHDSNFNQNFGYFYRFYFVRAILITDHALYTQSSSYIVRLNSVTCNRRKKYSVERTIETESMNRLRQKAKKKKYSKKSRANEAKNKTISIINNEDK